MICRKVEYTRVPGEILYSISTRILPALKYVILRNCGVNLCV